MDDLSVEELQAALQSAQQQKSTVKMLSMQRIGESNPHQLHNSATGY